MKIAVASAQAQAPSGDPVPVTVENFIRAESDRYFIAGGAKELSASSTMTGT
jgi:hypothetical protein